MNIPIRNTSRNDTQKAKIVRLKINRNIPAEPKDHLIIKNHEALHLITITELIYIKAEGNYTTLHFVDGKITASKTLKHFVNVLRLHKQFIRVHNGYVVNANFIRTIHCREGLSLRNTDVRIPISRRKKSDLINYFNQL